MAIYYVVATMARKRSSKTPVSKEVQIQSASLPNNAQATAELVRLGYSVSSITSISKSR